MFFSGSFSRRVAVGLLSLIGLGFAGCKSKGESVAEPVAPQNTGSCESNSDCSGRTAICDGIQGCVGCQYDADCETGNRCFDNACASAPDCSETSDCEGSSFPVCDTAAGRCEECLEDAECVDGNRCTDEKRCVPVVECKNSADCKNATVCDRSQGFCVECVADLDCAEGNVCEANACIPACETHEDCGDGLSWCDSVVGHCVQCIVDKDCPADYFCDSGSCSLDNCEPGTSFCDEGSNAVHECLENGRDHSVLLCSTGTTCVEGVSETSCENWICNPGSTFCGAEGDELNTCDLTGLALATSVSCGEMGGRCLNEVCVDVVCETGTNRCQDGNSYACDATGTELSLAQNCASGFFCNDSTGLCEVNKCAPNESTCDEDLLSTCNSEGSDYLADVVDCSATNRECVSGGCRDVICDFTTRCNGTTVETCVQEGTRIATSPCSVSYHCAESGGTASCQADVCTQDGTSCSAGVFQVCNADGSAYASTQDCAAEGLTCDYSAGCRAQLGSSVSYSYNSDYTKHVNHFLAEEDATLSQISMYMNTYSSTALTWLVYESATEFGDYTLKSSVPSTAASTSTVWHVSPTMNVALDQGNYYLIGVHIVNSDYVYYGSQVAGSQVGALQFSGRSQSYDPAPFVEPWAIASPTASTTAYYMRLSF